MRLTGTLILAGPPTHRAPDGSGRPWTATQAQRMGARKPGPLQECRLAD
jgi:hypothetical protein